MEDATLAYYIHPNKYGVPLVNDIQGCILTLVLQTSQRIPPGEEWGGEVDRLCAELCGDEVVLVGRAPLLVGGGEIGVIGHLGGGLGRHAVGAGGNQPSQVLLQRWPVNRRFKYVD